jgi:hypothetical protein
VTADQFLDQLRAVGYRAHRVEHGAVGAPLDRAPDATLVLSVVFIPA